jgi:fructokinase
MISQPAMRFGIDLGGSKIELVAFDARGQARLRRRVATPQNDYRATLAAIRDLVIQTEDELDAKGSIGIGTPGSLSRLTGRLRNSNSVCLNGQRIVEDLQALLGRPVRIANDANCFALSEATDGGAKGAEVVFGVILGTGVGAGIVVRGRVLEGANGIAGEWGHNPLPWPLAEELPGPPCYCGKTGCIETFVSGPALTNDHRHCTGTTLQADAIVAAATSGDAACESTLARYEGRVARALAHVINVLDPDVIVLGGGLSNLDRLYRNVPQLWSRYVFSDRVDTRLVRNVHGDSSGVRGAAWLWEAPES